MTHTVSLYDSILQDSLFTPALREQIQDVQAFQTSTERFVDGLVAGTHRTAVLQGPPGLGKSHAVAKAMDRAGLVKNKDYFVVKGHITPMQLFVVLYQFRRQGQFVILDDCDDIMTKDVGLEVLKAACDDEFREVCWHGCRVVINDTSVDRYLFNGTVIICTNMSIRTHRGGRRDRAAAALLSRAVVWDLRFNTRERQYAQLFNMVVNEGYLDHNPATQITDQQKHDLLKFVLEHLDELRSLDLRVPQQIAREMVANPTTWQHQARHMTTVECV